MGGTKVPSEQPLSCSFHWLWRELSSLPGTAETQKWRRSWNQTSSCISLSGAGSAWTGSEVFCVGRELTLLLFGALLLPLPQLDGQLRDLAGRLPVAWELGQLLSHSPCLSRPDSASFANPSLPFFLPRVPNGLVFSLRESECHLYTYLAVLCVFFCPAQL